MTVATREFQDGHDVYHPHPRGQRIGQITNGQLDWEIALVQLDPSIGFTNAPYFDVPSAKRLTSVNEISAGDWFRVGREFLGEN